MVLHHLCNILPGICLEIRQVRSNEAELVVVPSAAAISHEPINIITFLFKGTPAHRGSVPAVYDLARECEKHPCMAKKFLD